MNANKHHGEDQAATGELQGHIKIVQTNWIALGSGN